MSFKTNSRLVPLLVVLAIVGVFAYAMADPAPETVARVSVTTAHFDTTAQFTTTADTLAWGFLADEVQVFATESNADSVTVTLYRDASTLPSGFGSGSRVVQSGGVKIPPGGKTFRCAEGYSGIRILADAASSGYAVVASVTTKRAN